MAHLIEMHNINKSFWLAGEELQILKDITLSIDQGEFVAIKGKSGSGKTTLMNIIGCLDKATSGTYLLDGKNIADSRADELAFIRNQKIGFIFQTFNLLEDLTALDNVALPQLYAGAREREAKQAATKMLQSVDLGDRLTHYPHQLSGGQRQRVAVARALINNPSIILADEPTGNLDSKTGHAMFEIFKHLNQEHNITFVIVTHDRDIAAKTNRIIHLIDGRIDENHRTKNNENE